MILLPALLVACGGGEDAGPAHDPQMSTVGGPPITVGQAEPQQQDPGSDVPTVGDTAAATDAQVEAGSGATAAASTFSGGDCAVIVGAAQIDNDIVVQEGNTCTLQGTRVNGNVVIAAGGALVTEQARIDGNVEGNGHASVTMTGGSVDGNVQLTGGADASVESIVIDGNLEAVGGTASQTFTRNVVGGNLVCHGNNPGPVGSGNQVDGDKERQCRNL